MEKISAFANGHSVCFQINVEVAELDAILMNEIVKVSKLGKIAFQ